jgi:hypothetical protein
MAYPTIDKDGLHGSSLKNAQNKFVFISNEDNPDLRDNSDGVLL